MNGSMALLAIPLVAAGCDCIRTGIPLWEITTGHKITQQQSAFLVEPGVTRAEVVATLGLPSYEFHDLGVLAYIWRMGREKGGLGVPAGKWGEDTDWLIRPTQEEKVRGLFVAYDAADVILAHEIRSFRNDDVRAEAGRWKESLGLRQQPPKTPIRRKTLESCPRVAHMACAPPESPRASPPPDSLRSSPRHEPWMPQVRARPLSLECFHKTSWAVGLGECRMSDIH